MSEGANTNKTFLIAVMFGVVVLAGGFVLLYSGKQETPPSTQVSGIQTESTSNSSETSTEALQFGQEEAVNAKLDQVEEVTELKIEDLVVGTGAEAVSGKKITVNYKGSLTNETVFDSSYERNEPFSFTLGAGEVIQGWDKGFDGMKVGGKRKLTIPSNLGYGERGAGASIPPNSTLIFEVELLKVE